MAKQDSCSHPQVGGIRLCCNCCCRRGNCTYVVWGSVISVYQSCTSAPNNLFASQPHAIFKLGLGLGLTNHQH